MKKLLSLFAAVLMAVTVFAGRTFNGTEVLYLKASAVDWWQNGNAVQKATFDGTVVVVGVADANNSGYVGFTVPAGEYTTVKFSRHADVDAAPWNSTGNITIAAEGNCVMTFAQNSSDATWGTYDPSHVEVIVYSIKTSWKDGGWGAGFKTLTVNPDGTQSITETYTGNGFNISPKLLGMDWYPVEKLNLVGDVAANDLVTISVNPAATDQANVFTITKISSPEPEPELDPINVTVRVYTTAAAPKIWWWGGDIAGADASYTWEGRPSMNKEGETNWYSWTFEGVNATSGISYKITATGEKEFSGVKGDKCLDANLNDLDCEYAPEPEPEPEPIVYEIKTSWKDGGWDAGFKTLTVNPDGTQSIEEVYTGNGFNIKPSFLGTDWYPVEKLNLVGDVAANDLVTISVNPAATDQANVFTITKISSPDPEPELDPINVTVRVYTTSTAPKIWWWGGDIAAPTMDWKDRPSMNKEGETNWYSWTFEGVNATSGISYKITAASAEEEFSGVKENKCFGYDLTEIDCSDEPEADPEPEPIVYEIKTSWKDGGWDAGFKTLTVNPDGTQSIEEVYTGNGFNIKPSFLGTEWYPVEKLNFVGGVAAGDLVTISVNPNATAQNEVFTITKISSPEPDPTPDYLYILGNIEGIGWEPAASAEMTKNGDVFTGTYTFTEATSYFAFTTVQGGWDDVNANRYHSAALTADADPIALVKENGSSTIAQGTYTITVDWANMTISAVAAFVPTQIPVEISSYGYATLYTEQELEIPAGLTVEYITGISDNSLTHVTVSDRIPAGGAVLLSGVAGTYNFLTVETATADPLEGNLLKGTATAEVIANENVHYILSTHNGVFGLYWPYGTTEGVGAFTNQAGKAYLELPVADAPQGVRGFALRHTDTTTGNENVNANENVYKAILNGQLVIIRGNRVFNMQGALLK